VPAHLASPLTPAQKSTSSGGSSLTRTRGASRRRPNPCRRAFHTRCPRRRRSPFQGLRKLHWHPSLDEWSYLIRGHVRLTVFAAEGCARPFDCHPGDVDIVLKSMAYFTGNIGTDGSKFRVLEISRAPGLEDFSLDP
jgi:hypothetical protein